MTKIDTRGGRIKIEGGVVEKPWKKYTVGDVYCTFIKILLYRRYSFSLKLCFLFSAYLHIMWIKEYNPKKKISSQFNVTKVQNGLLGISIKYLTITVNFEILIHFRAGRYIFTYTSPLGGGGGAKIFFLN